MGEAPKLDLEVLEKLMGPAHLVAKVDSLQRFANLKTF